jgi:hypothetical protein
MIGASLSRARGLGRVSDHAFLYLSSDKVVVGHGAVVGQDAGVAFGTVDGGHEAWFISNRMGLGPVGGATCLCFDIDEVQFYDTRINQKKSNYVPL